MTELLTFRSPEDFKLVDYHMHTEFSDGDSDIEEYVEKASELGLEEIAITDHVWRSSDWVDEYTEEIEEVNRRHDIKIHAGLEAKVIDRRGSVDVSDEDAEKIDFVMGVVHRYRPEADEPYDDSLKLETEDAAQEETYLTKKMLENPKVDLVGHPSRTYYKFHYSEEEPHFPNEKLEEMIEAAKEEGKPLEYNARLPRHVRERLLKMYVDQGFGFTVGSDSHEAERLENLNHEHVRDVLTEGGVSA